MASLVDAFADFVGSVPYRETDLPWGTAHVWELGEGRPVVLLHGIAAGRRVFFRVAPQLAAGRRVVVPPLRGEEAAAPRHTHADLLDDLGALLDALDLREATLFGTSFGGWLALAYAARGDPRVADVVVQGTFARFRLRRADRIANALSYLLPARASMAYFRRRIRRGAESRVLAEHAPGLDVLLADWSAKTPLATLRRRIRLIANVDVAPDVKRIAVPLTIAHGRRDRVVPRAFFDELRGLRPDAKNVLWDDVGHNAALTHPELVASAIGD